MNRIIISETDVTSNELTNIGSDIVYIPGFAIGGTQAVRSPKLCTSISEFENAFGESAPRFIADQLYPAKSGSIPGFDSASIPVESGGTGVNIWYNKGTKDPSYIYAKELIRAGLPVVYERINNVTQAPSFAVDPNGNLIEGFNIYSNLATYAVNDYVIYNNAYYKCKTAISTPEELTASHWDAVDMTETPWFDVTVDRMYDAMMGNNLGTDETDIYNENVPGSLSEISTYNIKYITSGGYPTYGYSQTIGSGGEATTVELQQKLATLAASRGDAIAFIDHTNTPSRPLVGEGSVYNTVSSGMVSQATASFATMITPWGIYDTSEASNVSMPGSFGYFLALARALRAYPSWLPVAGIVRGLIPALKGLNTNKQLTNAIADAYQTSPSESSGNISINAITWINDQGYTIWGNRTATKFSDGFATTFLNMRNLVCDVKKRAFKAAQTYMFEQNTDVLWVNFKSNIEGLLDQMVSGRAVDHYKILRVATNDKTKIAAKIQIFPIYAVESFEISIILTDEEITVE